MKPDTQLQSYDEIKNSLSERRASILELIQSSQNGLPLFEIVKLSGLPINSVSGRITELNDLGMIKDSGSRSVNPETGKKAIVWQSVTTPIYDTAESQATFDTLLNVHRRFD